MLVVSFDSWTYLRSLDFKIVLMIFSLSGCPIAAMGKLVQTTQQTAKKSGKYLNPCCVMLNMKLTILY